MALHCKRYDDDWEQEQDKEWDRGVSMVDTRENRITVCACMILRNYKHR